MTTTEKHHSKLLQESSESLRTLLQRDPFLNNITDFQDVENLVRQAKGQNFVVFIDRGPHFPQLKVFVPESASVKDLKVAVQKSFPATTVSWKKFWRRNNLQFNQTILEDDKQQLLELGVRNKDALQFTRKRR